MANKYPSPITNFSEDVFVIWEAASAITIGDHIAATSASRTFTSGGHASVR